VEHDTVEAETIRREELDINTEGSTRMSQISSVLLSVFRQPFHKRLRWLIDELNAPRGVPSRRCVELVLKHIQARILQISDICHF